MAVGIITPSSVSGNPAGGRVWCAHHGVTPLVAQVALAELLASRLSHCPVCDHTVVTATNGMNACTPTRAKQNRRCVRLPSLQLQLRSAARSTWTRTAT